MIKKKFVVHVITERQSLQREGYVAKLEKMELKKLK